jgi:hypothetical protein
MMIVTDNSGEVFSVLSPDGTNATHLGMIDFAVPH